MMTLDARARHASIAIHDSVVNAGPTTSFAAALRRHRLGQFAAGALATAAVIVLFALVAAVRTQVVPDVADRVPPTVEVTVPDEVAPPVDHIEVDPEEPSPDQVEPQSPIVPVPVVTVPAEATTTTTSTTTEVPLDTEPPVLTVDSPEDGAHFDAAEVTFSGTTEAGAVVSAGRWLADVSSSGRWSIVLYLAEGGNRVTFTASDEAGNEEQATITVYLDPPETTTTRPPKDEPPAVEFTARSVYGECAENPPYDVYYGTATPGATITVGSDYGSGTTTSNEQGQWEVRVYFPESPVGTGIVVTVKDDEGHSKRFEFHRIAA